MSHGHGNNYGRRASASSNCVYGNCGHNSSSNHCSHAPPPYSANHPQFTSSNRSPSIIIYPDTRSEREHLLANSSSRAGENRDDAQQFNTESHPSYLRSLFFIIITFFLAFFAGRMSAESELDSAWEGLRHEKRAWMDLRRIREDEEKRDIERRQRAGLVWDDIEHEETCLAYGMRNYQAKLENVPDFVDVIKWCSETPFEIYGETYEKPRNCSVEAGDVIGHWIVKNDSYCHTTWTNFHDKGCTLPGSGLRRYEAKLDNFHRPDWPNGDVMCDTTPANFLGIHRDSPDYCLYYKGWYGYAGAWDVPDANCH